jgi:hypothetical protein
MKDREKERKRDIGKGESKESKKTKNKKSERPQKN